MPKKLIFMFLVVFCFTKIAYSQKIYTFEELEKTTSEEKEILKKIFGEYSAVNHKKAIKVFDDDNDKQIKLGRNIGNDFFVKFKTQINDFELLKKMKSGFEFDFILYFDEKGNLDYFLYSIEPQDTEYKLNEKNKEIFITLLNEVVKGYQPGVNAYKKYKIYYKYTQNY